ncbi:MAG: TolC family protein, partial [Phycisphaerae bacterium]|nr:TolC family protein [Phycisphaerae bacterium]
EMNLEQVLAYAFRHSRQFQTAKEQLYLAALDLTLERHLWTPRLFGEVAALQTVQQTARADARGNITLEPDNAFEAVARAGVRQRLPYGGEIIAETINTLVRNVSDHLTEGETGQTVIAAELPLLRGAGRSAFETRYQAERNLIYAIRTFEGFRRNLVVDIAEDYFNLQRLRQQIVNTEQSVRSFELMAQQERALFAAGRRSVLDVQRADQERLVATNDRVDAITTYQTALDAFKLRIGMPIETPIDVPLPSEPGSADAQSPKTEESLEAALRMPAVTEEEALAAALKYRLDLLNDLDRIGDAERGVNIAENNLLPDLRATSSVRFNTRPEQRGIGHYDDEHTVYTGGLTLELPLDRKAERNQLRRSIVNRNEAERNYEQARHEVIRQVRSAMRRVEQQALSLQIQIKNRDLALQRREAAQLEWERGRIGNRDLVEAENALLSARNRLAAAQAQMNLAILQFRRDTGTLRVDDEGRWMTIVRDEEASTREGLGG